MGLVAVAFLQQPGLLIADTKLDLALAPGEFLRRATSLWDPEGAFGQLQNQGYGYLWPMGPFFWVGDLLGAPAWATQRTWIGLVMVTGFVGVVWLCRLLGVRSGAACLVAGVAYALSPRMISLLGQISVEVWPGALAPWVLAFLVRGSLRGSPVTAAASSAAAVAMVGGVNAAATAAVLPLGALWLLTRAPGPRRRSLMVWWPLLTLLGTCWWLVPLFVLGAYSPPFLDYIESAEVTTLATPLFDALRGTSDWVAYVDATWRAGNDLVGQGFWVVSGTVVLVLGLAGVVRRDQPHRGFLMAGLMTGLLMLTFGHTGALQGWWAPEQQRLLDGPLAPLRNVHKFDLVVRLVLVVGLAHAIERLSRSGDERSGGASSEDRGSAGAPRSTRVAVVALALLAVVGAAGPALVGRMAPAGAYVAVPAYWEQAAEWLAENDDGGRALLLPGSSFGSFAWGFTRDEPMQVLAGSPWAVRNAVPLAPPGNVRMLDAVERVLASGEGSPGLASYLRRAGVSRLVVRHDLPSGGRLPDPVLVEQALRDSPGLRPSVSFGPVLGGATRLDARDGGPRLVVNRGWQDRLPAIRVWEVPGVSTAAVAEDTPVVVGGPETLLDLADLGVIGSRPTLLAADLEDPGEHRPAGVVLTDGLRRREASFGAVHDATSATLAPEEGRLSGRPVSDYRVGVDEESWDRWRASARAEGVGWLGASSSASDADNPGPVLPGRSPWAAWDEDPSTQWVSGRDTGTAPWIEARLEGETVVAEVGVTLGDAVPAPTVVRVVTDTGASRPRTLVPGESAAIGVPVGPTGRVRVEGASGAGLALAEVTVPGVRVRRVVDLPALPEAWGAPEVIALTEGLGHRTGCVEVSGDLRCAAGRARASEEPAGLRRTVDLGETGRYRPSLRVRARDGAPMVARLQDDLPLVAASSSSVVEAPGGSALAAVDGDAGTAWVADPEDPAPTLDLRWLDERRVDAIRVSLDPDAPGSPARRAVVRWPGGEQSVTLDDEGFAPLEPFRTTRATVELSSPEASRSLDFDGTSTDLGIGVSEIRLRGTARFPQVVSRETEAFGCGSGPSIRTGDGTVLTEVVASRADLVRGEQVDARPCGEDTILTVPAGRTPVEVIASDLFAPSAVRLDLAEGARAGLAGPSPAPLALEQDGTDRRRTAPVPSGSTLVVRENANAGWLADGGARPVLLDGWQQGWRVDDGGPVELRFGPQTVYVAGLVGGAVAFVLLWVVLVLTWYRRPGAELPVGGGRDVPRVAGAVVLGLSVALLSGTTGLVVAAVATLVHPLLRRLSEGPRSLAVGSGVAVAGAFYWVRPLGAVDGWAGDSSIAQLAVLVSLVWAGLEVLGRSRRGHRTLRNLVAGSSTQR